MIRVIKRKKDVPTVIEYDGRRYVLDNKTTPKEARNADAHRRGDKNTTDTHPATG